MECAAMTGRLVYQPSPSDSRRGSWLDVSADAEQSLLGSIGAGLQTIVGGNITLYTQLCEKTREDAYELMMQHAAEHGANAVIAMRYDATEVMQGVTEVLAYGTAVQVERIS